MISVKSVKTYFGISTERIAIPLTSFLPGDVFVETDANETYQFNGMAWVQIAGSVSGSFLEIANNLSDLNNTATARTNLGLVAGGTGDIWVEKAGDTMTGPLIIDSSDSRIKLFDDDESDSYFQIDEVASNRVQIDQVRGTDVGGNAVIDINPIPLDGISDASFRFFRSTNTTGTKRLTMHRGDGSATVDHDFYGGGGYAVGSPSGGNPGVGAISLNSHLNIDANASTPSNPGSLSSFNMYLKGNKVVFQFNDSGTVRYKYLDLTGTGVTWVHSTAAP